MVFVGNIYVSCCVIRRIQLYADQRLFVSLQNNYKQNHKITRIGSKKKNTIKDGGSTVSIKGFTKVIYYTVNLLKSLKG